MRSPGLNLENLTPTTQLCFIPDLPYEIYTTKNAKPSNFNFETQGFYSAPGKCKKVIDLLFPL